MTENLTQSMYLLPPKAFFILIVLCTGLQSFTCRAQVDRQKAIDGRTYRLTFADEFDGADLDTTQWVYRTDSKHWSTQLPGNVDIKKGFLRLNLKKEKASGKDYTGAGIISVDSFQYGYYETRMKIPQGAGWHNSFWLMQHDGQGGTGVARATIEIDICENDSKNPTGYGVNLHRWKGRHVDMSEYVQTPPLDEDFHIIACAYTPDYIKYYFDHQEVRTIDLKKLNFPQGSLNIWLTSIASHLGGTQAVDDGKLPGAALFDYVRFYALEE